jgi:hypothetical protein
MAIVLCAAVCRGDFHRGDCNSSGELNGFSVEIADVVAIASYLRARFDPPCVDACDANDDGDVDISDIMFLASYLFLRGPFPPAPGPGLGRLMGHIMPISAGEDPTDDNLDCGSSVN